MSMLSRLGIGLGALVVAVAIGAGAYAMMGDDGDGGGDSTAVQETANDSGDAAGGTRLADGEGMAMCAPGVTDCIDVVVEGDGDAARCAADGLGCMDTGPATERICIDDGTDAVCNDTVCAPADGGGTTAAGPDETLDPATSGFAGTEASDPELVDPPAEGEVAPDCAPAGEPCGEGECLPPDCAVASDGTMECVDPELAEDLRAREEAARGGSSDSNGSGGSDVDPQ